MIYVDTSVVLAFLFAEPLLPPDRLWQMPLVASKLLQYEVWTKLHTKRVGAAHQSAARDILGKFDFLDMTDNVLARAVNPFPVPLRTLGALHLASLEYLRANGIPVELASYDGRMIAAAHALKVPLYSL